MLLRLGEQFVPARHLANLDPALFARIARHQLIQRSLHRQFLFPQRPGQLLDRRRLIRRVNNRFQCRSSLFARHGRPGASRPSFRTEQAGAFSFRFAPAKAASLRSEESLFSLLHYVIASLLRLFVLLINLLNPPALIKRQIKHLMLPHQNLPKLFLLRQRHCLQFHHLQHRQKRHNHCVPRRTSLKKLHQIHRIVRARQDLRPDLRDHLRHGKLFVPQLDPRHFLPPLQHLLEHSHQIHERNHQIALGPFVVVERLVRLRPYVLFNLLLLIQKLRRILEFLVFHQALHQVRPRIFRLFRPGQRIRRQQHLRFDVDQRRRHINKFRRHIHVQLFQFVQVVEVLRRDLRNLNIVNIHLLLFDQIQQQVQRPLIHRYIDFVRRRHSLPSLPRSFISSDFVSFFLPPKNRLPHPLHRSLCHLPRLLRPFIQNLQRPPRMLLIIHSSFPHRRNPFNQMIRHLRLALDAANPRGPATLRCPFQRFSRREQFMPVIHRTHVRISWVRPPLPRRVRHHHLRLCTNLRVALAQRNRVPVTLRHLPPVRPRYPRRQRQFYFRLLQYRQKFDHVRHCPGLQVFNGVINSYF